MQDPAEGPVWAEDEGGFAELKWDTPAPRKDFKVVRSSVISCISPSSGGFLSVSLQTVPGTTSAETRRTQFFSEEGPRWRGTLPEEVGGNSPEDWHWG